MRRRAFYLYGTLWLLALLTTLSCAVWVGAGSVRQRLDGHKHRQQAAAMALSGREYLSVVLDRRLASYRSPVFEGGGYFTIAFDGNGRAVVTGCCGRARVVAR